MFCPIAHKKHSDSINPLRRVPAPTVCYIHTVYMHHNQDGTNKKRGTKKLQNLFQQTSKASAAVQFSPKIKVP